MITTEPRVVEKVEDAVNDFPFELHPQQGLAFESDATEILFGGAKGGGKSFLLRFAMCLWCMMAPGLQCYLFRRLYPDLMLNHMEGPASFHMMLAKLVEKQLCVIVSHQVRFWTGGRIYLNHMQHEKSVTKYQGPEIHVLGMDELTQFTEAQYRYVRGSVRLGKWAPPPDMQGVFPKIIAGANPGGVSHKFVKQWWIENGPYKIQPPLQGMRRQFIPSRAEDNPTLLTNDPQYLDRLEGMGSPALVKAMREGDWNIVAGSMFGDTFRAHRHVCKPFAIPFNWPIWRGGDDGFTAPLSVHWLTEDPETFTIYVIAELYKTRLLPDEAAELILKQDILLAIDYGNDELGDNDAPIYGLMDSAAFSDTGTGRKSRANQMNDLGTNWKPVSKAPGRTGTGDRTNFRVMRVQALHQALGPNRNEHQVDMYGQQMPGIRFFDSCVNAIETIPALQVSDLNPEDITQNDDHCFDSVSYALTRVVRFFKRPKTGL